MNFLENVRNLIAGLLELFSAILDFDASNCWGFLLSLSKLMF